MNIDTDKLDHTFIDKFEIPRSSALHRIEWTRGVDNNPEVSLKAQQLHGQSYVEYGYFDSRGLGGDGRLVPELDGTREKPDSSAVINYLLAVPIGGEINEATATLRMIDIGEGGTIDDIPTYKYFKNSLEGGVREKLEEIVAIHGNSSVREVSALATASSKGSHLGSYELMRAIAQNAVIKRERTGISDIYIAALTSKSIKPVLNFAGHGASEVIGSPVNIFTDDERSARDLQVIPVLLDPCAVIGGIVDELHSATSVDQQGLLVTKLKFMTDGLSDRQMGDRAAEALKVFNA